MMSNLFKGFLVAGDKYFMIYIQNQKDNYDNGDNIYKDKLMTPDFNKEKHICTKDRWLAKSHAEEQIVGISSELKKIKDTNIKLEKIFKAKGTPKFNTTKQVNPKGSKKKRPKIIMMTSMIERKSLTNKGKGDKKYPRQNLPLV